MILIPTKPRIPAPLKPSHVLAIGYDASTSTLRAVFGGGATYDYNPVSPDIAARVIFAESVSSALDELVKKPKIPFVKLAELTNVEVAA